MKAHTWYALPDKQVLAQTPNTQDTIHRPYEVQEESRPKLECFSPSQKGEQNTHGKQRVSWTWEEDSGRSGKGGADQI